MRAPRVKVVGRAPIKRKDAAYLAAVETIRGAQGGARRTLKQLRGGWAARTRARRRAFASGIARFEGHFRTSFGLQKRTIFEVIFGPLLASKNGQFLRVILGDLFGASGPSFLVAFGAGFGPKSGTNGGVNF